MDFQTIWILKGILAKFLSEKSWSWETFLSFKYALIKLVLIKEENHCKIIVLRNKAFHLQ